MRRWQITLRYTCLVFALMGLALAATADGYVQDDYYKHIRRQFFELTPEMFPPRNGMLALLMETGYEGEVVTVIAVAEGSTSLYFSKGGGVIGAGESDLVAEVVFETLAMVF